MRYSRSFFVFGLATLTLVVVNLQSAQSQDGAKKKQRADRMPNIIMIMSDDQGWGDVGFNGNEVLQTPNLDAMAAGGMQFERFYAAAPLCSPTRGSCLTGRFPSRYGILAAHTAGMRVGEITIPEILKEKGYRTAHFGKWHIGWVKHEEAVSYTHLTLPTICSV